MLSAIVRWSLTRPRLVAVGALVLLVYGSLTLSRAKFDVFPDFVPAQAEVQTESRGLTAEQVEQLVTRPVEQAVNGAAGVAAVRSESIQGLSVVSIIFAEGSDPYRARQVVAEAQRTLNVTSLSVGNPHCVTIVDDLSKVDLLKLGPLIENHKAFPNRTNVQFAQVLDRANVRALIWERGAGYTLASGSSSSAAAAVARRLGLCDSEISVHMPGGKIQIEIAGDYSIRMTGAVTKVSDGIMAREMFNAPIPA